MNSPEQPTPQPPAEEDPGLLQILGRLLLVALLGGAAAFAAFQIFGPGEGGEAMVRVPGGSVPLRGLCTALVCAAAGVPVGAVVLGLVYRDAGRGMVVGAVSGFLGGGIGGCFDEWIPAVIFGALGAVLFILAKSR